MSNYNNLKDSYKKNNKQTEFNELIKKEVDIIIRQTEYNSEEALQKLIEHDMNKESIIKEFMGIEINPQKVSRTVNQKVFDEFRNFLDESSENYYKNK
jgi:hypothetical protein